MEKKKHIQKVDRSTIQQQKGMNRCHAGYLQFDSADESLAHYAEWKKPVTKADMWCHSTSMKL